MKRKMKDGHSAKEEILIKKDFTEQMTVFVNRRPLRGCQFWKDADLRKEEHPVCSKRSYLQMLRITNEC